MDRLQQLHNDKATTDLFKEFFVGVLEEETIKRVFAKKDITGIAEARELLDKVFNRLDDIYKVEKKRVQPNSK
jgi:hypothetical protein